MYYSQVDKQSISGYKISNLVGHKTWSVNIGPNQKLVDIQTQYTTQSLASEPKNILPTLFGVEGVLLYKYLDSNMFAVTTQNIQDLGTYTVLFINGVTGSIIY